MAALGEGCKMRGLADAFKGFQVLLRAALAEARMRRSRDGVCLRVGNVLGSMRNPSYVSLPVFSMGFRIQLAGQFENLLT